MTLSRPQRRLAAIMSIDVVGYSRLMGADEEGTLTNLNRLFRQVVSPELAAHRGRVVKLLGDGAIVEFKSVVDAVSAGIAIQKRGPAFNENLAPDSALMLRIGINLGDVIPEGKDIFGDGVNVAARLQSICTPGALAISGSAHEHVSGRLDECFQDAGERELKNIARKVRVFRWPDGETQADKPALSLPDKPSVAILPFDNMSGDPAQEYFADGVVESMTAALSRIRSFFVIARNSAFAYKGRHMNVVEIGRELGVAYVVEGSVQRAGGRIRITVQLIETAGGAHIWADRYDGTDEDLFELQDRITEKVAGALQPSIQWAEIERTGRKPPQDMGAYDHAMRAMRHVWMLEKDEATRALEILDEALAADPDYPLALALAAWCWAQRSVYNWTEDFEGAQGTALKMAERAAALSSDDPLILAVLGAVHTFARNYGTARVLLERAIMLDPNAAWALSRLGWLEVYADRPEVAFEYFEHAIRLSPLDPLNFSNMVGIAHAHQIAGDYELAVRKMQRALEEWPSAYWIHRHLCVSLLACGRLEEAKASRDMLMKAYPNASITLFRRAMVFSPDTLEKMLGQMRELGIPE